MEFADPQILLKYSLTDLVRYLGAIQGVILAIIVFNYPLEHKISNRILAFFILLQAHCLIAPRIVEVFQSNYIWMIYGVRFFGVIMLYLYIKSLYQKIRWENQLWHLLVILMDFLLFFVRATIKAEGQNFQYSGVLIDYINICWYVCVISLYMYLGFIAFQEYKEKVLRNFTNLHYSGLKWVGQMYSGFLFLLIVDIVFVGVSFTYTEWFWPYQSLIHALSYTFFMYFISIKGKLTPLIYQLRILEDLPQASIETVHENNREELLGISNQVMEVMEKELLFKEEGLCVKDIADKIGVKPYLVSQAINSCLGKNFFELVNGCRIEEAKKLMLDSKFSHLSMLGIGIEAGFSSKTAFNTAFKKHTGIIPSQYKKSKLLMVK